MAMCSQWGESNARCLETLPSEGWKRVSQSKHFQSQITRTTRRAPSDLGVPQPKHETRKRRTMFEGERVCVFAVSQFRGSFRSRDAEDLRDLRDLRLRSLASLP